MSLTLTVVGGGVVTVDPDQPEYSYGEVVTVMVALQEAGAPSVCLVTENPQ